MFKRNPLFTLLDTDSYKLGHMNQYPEGTELVYSNWTPRSLRILNDRMPAAFQTDSIVWVGVQAVIESLRDSWDQDFFGLDRIAVGKVINDFCETVAPFCGNFDASKLWALWAYGSLPIEVRALPEGSDVPAGVPCMLIYNTQPEFFWITNFLETTLSNRLWTASTSATIARQYRRIFEKFADETGADKAFIDWQGHDFSARGMETYVGAALSGFGHLTSFTGTDTLSAIPFIQDYYEGRNTFIGGSVPATEHSVMCMGGADGEIDLFRRLITQVYPSGIVSIVSDTWDYWTVITEYLPALRNEILDRKVDAFGNAKVVIRPDSGDPVRIIAGYLPEEIYEDGGKFFERGTGNELSSAEVNGSIETMWKVFGGSFTSKGYRMLNPRIGLIYGDSITPERAVRICEMLKEKGFASTNWVAGIGSFTYQYNTRDTLGFAMKATYGEVGGEGRELFKEPKTDNGTKKSARGLLRVAEVDGRYKLFDRQSDIADSGALETIFRDGVFYKRTTLEDIRGRVRASI